jgi:hypothetical protein
MDKKPMALLFSLVAFAATALAVASATAPYPGTDDMLLARYDQISCRVTYTQALLGEISSQVPEAASLDDYITMLDDDLSQLQGYADSGDYENFNSYVTGTYLINQAQATAALVDAVGNYEGWGISLATRASIKEGSDEAKSEFLDCQMEALTALADAKVVYYNGVLDYYSSQMADLESKGLDTSKMESLISDARTQVVTPLESATSSANDGTKMLEAISSYCLGNGCPNEMNFHFWGRFTYEKLQASLDTMEPYVSGSDQAASLADEAQGYLDAAETGLKNIGTTFCSETGCEGIWNNLENAAETLVELLNELK